MRAADHARALIEANRTGAPPPIASLAWVAGGLEMHLHVGIALPLALGLAGYDGTDVSAERRRQRDDLIREVARRWFPEFGPTQAAVAVSAAVGRQSHAQGRVTDDRSRALEVLARCEPPLPSTRTIRRVLATNPVGMATADR